MPTRSIKYTGDLGRPIPLAKFRAELRRVADTGGNPRQWLEDEVQRRLALLLAHFGIEQNENAWERLARSLAAAHVPGLRHTASTESPPKALAGPMTTIMAAMAMKKDDPRSRPWTLDVYCDVLEDLRLGREELEKQQKRVTIVGAIAAQLATKNPEMRPAQVRAEARRLAKLVSRAGDVGMKSEEPS
jgi:hypothetical protein